MKYHAFNHKLLICGFIILLYIYLTRTSDCYGILNSSNTMLEFPLIILGFVGGGVKVITLYVKLIVGVE